MILKTKEIGFSFEVVYHYEDLMMIGLGYKGEEFQLLKVLEFQVKLEHKKSFGYKKHMNEGNKHGKSPNAMIENKVIYLFPLMN